jgi:hypothetical protein
MNLVAGWVEADHWADVAAMANNAFWEPALIALVAHAEHPCAFTRIF